MRIVNIINHLEPNKRKALAEMLRFVLVGGTATALQYAIYIVALKVMNHNLALTLGYGISFIFNFFASTYFTFKVKANARRGMGFALSHVVNYFMQLGVLNAFLYIGVPQKLAPLPMFAVCVPINFILVRFFLTKK